jgi:hypothetical protein
VVGSALLEQRRAEVYVQGQELLGKLPSDKTDFAGIFRAEFLSHFLRRGGLAAKERTPDAVTITFFELAVVYGAIDVTSSYRPIAWVMISSSNDRPELMKGYARSAAGSNPSAPAYITLNSLLAQPAEVAAQLAISTTNLAQQCAEMVATAQNT